MIYQFILFFCFTHLKSLFSQLTHCWKDGKLQLSSILFLLLQWYEWIDQTHHDARSLQSIFAMYEKSLGIPCLILIHLLMLLHKKLGHFFRYNWEKGIHHLWVFIQCIHILPTFEMDVFNGWTFRWFEFLVKCLTFVISPCYIFIWFSFPWFQFY